MLLESTAEGIFGLDIEGRCTFINKAAATMLGYKPEDCLGRDIERMICHNDVNEPAAAAQNGFIQRAKLPGGRRDQEAIFWRSDKTCFPVENSSYPISTGENQISGAVVTFTDISERKQAESSQRKRLEEIQVLHEIGQTILNSKDLQTIVESILDKIQSLGGFELGLVRLLDRGSNLRKPVASRGYRNPEKIRSVASDPDDPRFASSHASVLEAGQAKIIDDVPAAPGIRTIKQEGAKSAVIVPIRMEAVIIGTILLASRAPKTFKEEEIRLLEAIGHQLGIAVQKSWLEEATQSNLDRIRALHEIGKAITSTLDLGAILQILFEKIGQYVPYHAASLRLKNPETGLLEIVAAPNTDLKQREFFSQTGDGLTRVVFESQAPLIVKNIQQDPRATNPALTREIGFVSMLGVPLVAKGECLGVLALFTREEYEPSSEEVDFALALAGQAAMAIQNSHMYQQVQKRETDIEQARERLATLYSIAAASCESLDLDSVLKEVIRRITEIFKFNATRIFLFDSAREKLLLRASFETSPELFEGLTTFLPGQGLIGKVAESGEPLIFDDVTNDPRYLDLSHSKRTRKLKQSFLAVLPIKGKYRTLGSMLLSHAQPRSVSSNEIDLLTAITRQVAIAVENMALFEETVKRAEELWAKTLELAAANKVKDEFLSIMSHELRTPLNVILGYLALVRDKMFGDLNAEQDNALGKINRQTAHLLSMVQDILRVTQLDSGGDFVHWERVSVSSFLEELKVPYELPLDKEIAILWDYPDDLPVVETDKEKLTRVLQNLINNAIKFTDHGTITVSVRVVEDSEQRAVSGEQLAENREQIPVKGSERPVVSCQRSVVSQKTIQNETRPTQNAKPETRNSHSSTPDPKPHTLDARLSTRIEFKVTDTGSGIPSESLPFIFEKFHQVDSSNTRDYGGVGLGLYIAKKETELLGGKIEVESELGKGTVFTVSLPCDRGTTIVSESPLDAGPQTLDSKPELLPLEER
jgi:PAS domain S-box-containing protein